MSYAIRSGIAITSTYALKQCGRLMKVSIESSRLRSFHVVSALCVTCFLQISRFSRILEYAYEPGIVIKDGPWTW
jgi:hypothetical protein